MAAAYPYECKICGYQVKEKAPRRCPRCGAGASRFRLVVPPLATVPASAAPKVNGESLGAKAEGAPATSNGAGKPEPAGPLVP